MEEVNNCQCWKKSYWSKPWHALSWTVFLPCSRNMQGFWGWNAFSPNKTTNHDSCPSPTIPRQPNCSGILTWDAGTEFQPRHFELPTLLPHYTGEQDIVLFLRYITVKVGCYWRAVTLQTTCGEVLFKAHLPWSLVFSKAWIKDQ